MLKDISLNLSTISKVFSNNGDTPVEGVSKFLEDSFKQIISRKYNKEKMNEKIDYLQLSNQTKDKYETLMTVSPFLVFDNSIRCSGVKLNSCKIIPRFYQNNLKGSKKKSHSPIMKDKIKCRSIDEKHGSLSRKRSDKQNYFKKSSKSNGIQLGLLINKLKNNKDENRGERRMSTLEGLISRCKKRKTSVQSALTDDRLKNPTNLYSIIDRKVSPDQSMIYKKVLRERKNKGKCRRKTSHLKKNKISELQYLKERSLKQSLKISSNRNTSSWAGSLINDTENDSSLVNLQSNQRFEGDMMVTKDKISALRQISKYRKSLRTNVRRKSFKRVSVTIKDIADSKGAKTMR